MNIKHFILTFIILELVSGCVATKIMTLDQAATYNSLNPKKRDFLILFNQNNQYELHNYQFQKDSLTGELYVPRIRRSNGLMVFTAADFRIDNISASMVRIPNDKIIRIQEVKPDIFRTVAFAAGVTLFTFSLWWAGNLILSGIY
jgi:hypothetical protein